MVSVVWKVNLMGLTKLKIQQKVSVIIMERLSLYLGLEEI